MHTVSWKKNGGLGLCNLKDMNETFIAKLGIKLKSGDESLWCKVMCGKYDKKNIRRNEVLHQVYDSSF